jgi:hypothetical protein
MNARIEKRYAAGETLSDIAASLGLDYDDGAVWLPGYWADDGNAEILYETAATGREAAREYVDGGDWGDGSETFAVEVSTWRAGFRVEDGELVECRGEDDSHLILQDPDEPGCEGSVDGKHRWESPHELLGGCESNPGVWGGNGCSISSTEVCVVCGCGKHTRTASQGANTVHDHDSVEYKENEFDVHDLVQYHGSDFPEDLDPESPVGQVLLAAIVEAAGYEPAYYCPNIIEVPAEEVDEAVAALREALPGRFTVQHDGQIYARDDQELIDVSLRF